MTKELLFRLTAKDFVFKAERGSGPGGQHRNKVATAVRCTHPESGAVGFAQDNRSQLANKRAAFKRCTDTPEFQRWLNLEGKRRSGALAVVEAEIERNVNRAMLPHNLLVEVGDGENWVEEGTDA